jgi:NTP pyrophosphatase (non-canonical NTP hydrolase)
MKDEHGFYNDVNPPFYGPKNPNWIPDELNLPVSCGVMLNPAYAVETPTFTSYPSGINIGIAEMRRQQAMGATLDELMAKVVQWHYDRNLIYGSTDKDQTLKLAQELGELSDSVCKGKDVKDDLGDMLVVMLNIAQRNGLSLRNCLEVAWEEIKDRKGQMVDGIFVKEQDL